jgi:hypothetical protein
MKSFKQYLLEVGEQLTFDFDKPQEPVYTGTAYSPETLDDRKFDKGMYRPNKPTPKPTLTPKTIKGK